MLRTPEKIRELQRKLYQKAKQEKEYRFYLLYDKVYRQDILTHAYGIVKANKGAPGVDGETFESIGDREGGVEGYLEEIAGELRRQEYRPKPVRRVYIPKPNGGKRPAWDTGDQRQSSTDGSENGDRAYIRGRFSG